MIDKCKFESWKTPGISEEKIEELFKKAKNKTKRRRFQRRMTINLTAVFLVSLAAASYILFSPRSFNNRLAEARALIKEEIKDKGEIANYIISDDDRGLCNKEIFYEINL